MALHAGEDEGGLRVGKVLDRFRMAKHFELTITDTGFAYGRKATARQMRQGRP